MERIAVRRLLLCLGMAAALTLACGCGLLYGPDHALADSLYNRRQSQEGIVTVIGIDRKALEEIGPLPWSREVMARAVEKLNEDPNACPAVIALDVQYVGETDRAADEALVKAAANGGNVVVAEAADMKEELEVDGGDFYKDPFSMTGYDPVFAELRAVTRQGHINAMLDADGILRHGLLYLEIEGARTYSLGWAAYELYCERMGLEAGPMPKTNRSGFFYLPYTGTLGSFSDGISVADILDGSVPGSYFKDKIVLIGPYAAGLQDQYITSIDHGQPQYGVEIQANAIASFLRGDSLTEAADGWQLALLFAVCALASFAFLALPLKWAALLWIVCAGGDLGLCLLMKNQGVLLHPLWLPLSLTVLYIVCVAVNYVRAALEKKKVTDTFKRYVDPSVIRELLREGTDSLELGGKMTEIAVLFVDIRGFTSMSEILSPPEVVEILNRYLSLTTKCVMENHGTLDKFVGDCTMAIWNAPLPQEDYIMNACRAALDMVQGSAALSEELQETYGRTVSFGVGVHCGGAVVGNIGAKMRMDFTAIGDTVNTAARLEANAPGGTVYISRAVADALGDRIRATSLGTAIKLKGKADGFEILTLDGFSPSEQGTA